LRSARTTRSAIAFARGARTGVSTVSIPSPRARASGQASRNRSRVQASLGSMRERFRIGIVGSNRNRGAPHAAGAPKRSSCQADCKYT